MLQKLKAAALLAHPFTWWMAGLAIAVIAGQAIDLFTVTVCIGVALGATLLFRSHNAWAKSIRFYLALSGFVVAVRLAFRVIFNPGIAPSDSVLISLPSLSIATGVGGNLTLFGAVGKATLEAALLDGLRLAAIILGIAMATTLANPRRLLKLTPAALYEVAAAVSVAINLAPQLIESLQRVRKARALRGRNKSMGALNSIVIPALEDTLDRSLQLAASMDARGFGRTGQLTRRLTLVTRWISLASASGLAIGAFLLVTTSNQILSLGILAASLLGLVTVVRITSRRNVKTTFVAERFGGFDAAVLATFALLLTITVGLGGWVSK